MYVLPGCVAPAAEGWPLLNWWTFASAGRPTADETSPGIGCGRAIYLRRRRRGMGQVRRMSIPCSAQWQDSGRMVRGLGSELHRHSWSPSLVDTALAETHLLAGTRAQMSTAARMHHRFVVLSANIGRKVLSLGC